MLNNYYLHSWKYSNIIVVLCIGKDCIFLTSVDVDKSGLSYYGELNLYYASVKGDTAKIKLG